MVKFRFLKLNWVVILLLALAGLGLSGCATSEPDNMSARPWNSPMGWENGLPAGMLEGR
jgi:hypothetical protein